MGTNDSKINEIETEERDEYKTLKTTYPELWPGWQTVRLIGQGSYGAVYEIRRETKGFVESAALKVISIPKEESEVTALRSNGMDNVSITNWFDECMQDMLKEYGRMKDMKGHTNIVYCDDFNTVKHDDGLGWDIYIKMELLTALTDVIEQKDFSEVDIIRLGKDMCKALMVCKSKNVVHRDVKPQNIFVSQDGDYKLGDFGVSIISDHTTSAQTAGTYKYMAPEVYFNKPYGSKADIYSLGLVMYWLLNQRRAPFEPLPPQPVMKSNADKARMQRFNGEPLPAPCSGSEELKRIVLKACEFKIEDRYQTAEEMLEDLEGIGKAKRKKPLGKIIGAIAGAALLVGAAVFGISRLGKNQKSIPTEPEPSTVLAVTEPSVPETVATEIAATEPAGIAYDSETMYRIILTASEDMNVKEFNASLDTVKERLDILTGGAEYGFTTYEDTVELILPKDCLYGVDVENALMCYISRPTELFLLDPETAGWFAVPTKIELSREDIESVVVKNGSIEGIDPAEHGITSTTYPYLEMTVTEAVAEKIAAETTEWSGIVLAQDVSLSTWFYMDVVLQEDGRTLCVLNNDIEGNFIELMAYNYSHDILPNAFYYSVEPQVSWIDTAEAFNLGKNQCNEAELSGKAAMVFYTTYNISDTASGDWIDICAVFQERLDALEQPYAIGYEETEDGINAVFKTNPEHLSLEIMELIGSYNYGVTLRMGLKQQSFYSDVVGSIVENADGTLGYSINMDSSDSTALQEFTKGIKEETELILIVNNTPVLSTYIEAPITDGKVVFQNLIANDHEVIQDSNVWMVNLVNSIISGESTSSLYYDRAIFCMDEDGEVASEADFSINYVFDEAGIRKVIANHAPDATVKFSRSSISVYLDLDVDETLAETSTNLVKKIYNDLDFEGSYFDSIGFYLIEEDNDVMERARIFFNKNYFEGRITANGIFKNGRLDKYKQYFSYIVSNSAFYYQKTMGDKNAWDV